MTIGNVRLQREMRQLFKTAREIDGLAVDEIVKVVLIEVRTMMHVANDEAHREAEQGRRIERGAT